MIPAILYMYDDYYSVVVVKLSTVQALPTISDHIPRFHFEFRSYLVLQRPGEKGEQDLFEQKFRCYPDTASCFNPHFTESIPAVLVSAPSKPLAKFQNEGLLLVYDFIVHAVDFCHFSQRESPDWLAHTHVMRVRHRLMGVCSYPHT